MLQEGVQRLFVDVLAKWSNGTQEIEKKLGENVIENLPPNTCYKLRSMEVILMALRQLNMMQQPNCSGREGTMMEQHNFAPSTQQQEKPRQMQPIETIWRRANDH